MTAVASPLSTRPRRPVVPWTSGDATRLLLVNTAGAFTVLVGWVGTSGTADLSDQFAWTSLAVLGFLVAGTGNGLWLLSGRRAVGIRLEALLDGAPQTTAEPSAEVVVETRVLAPVDDDQLVAPAAATRFHRRNCVLVRDKDVDVASLSGHRKSGRVACEVCQP